MSAVTKKGLPSPIQLAIPSTQKYAGLIAGEDLGAGDACFIRDDGMVYQSKDQVGSGSSTSEMEFARVDGYAAVQTIQGCPVTLLHGCVWAYYDTTVSANPTPGQLLYLSGTVGGGLNTAPANSNAKACGLTLPGGKCLLEKTWGGG